MSERNFGNPGPMDNDTGREILMDRIENTRQTRPQSPLFVGIWAAAILYALVYFVTRALGWW